MQYRKQRWQPGLQHPLLPGGTKPACSEVQWVQWGCQGWARGHIAQSSEGATVHGPAAQTMRFVFSH